MRPVTLITTTALAVCLSGCGSNLTCDDPQAYQEAVEVTKIDAPDGLDGLEESREMVIPRSSPRDPRPPGSPCLDLPPTIPASRSD